MSGQKMKQESNQNKKVECKDCGLKMFFKNLCHGANDYQYCPKCGSFEIQFVKEKPRKEGY